MNSEPTHKRTTPLASKHARQNIIIIGAAGSGKGTQAGMISEHYKIPHLSTGDIIRETAASGTAFGKKLEQIINKGILISDDDMLTLLKQKLDKCKKGFVLEGYPRNTTQAKTLETIAKIDKVIFLNVTDDEVVRRLSTRWQCKCGEIYNTGVKKPKKMRTGAKGVVSFFCNKCKGELYQRDDDKPDAIRKRLEIFHKDTQPIIDFYRKKGTLNEIKQRDYPNEVFAEVRKILG
ncbi:MAG TPA: nucleoside monophosphate kinase [archaeon]|nr:nucleoside monophosphate kinase [archaeon]